MSKSILLLTLLAIIAGGYRNTAKKQATDTTATSPPDTVANCISDTAQQTAVLELEIEPPSILDIIEHPEPVKQQRQQRTTPYRNIIVEVQDTVQTHAQIFWYSPRMENKDYSYRKELGGDNNFCGLTDVDNMARVAIPDTCEQGAKLMIRAIGYEPADIPADSIGGKDRITVQLTPKTYHCTVALKERKFPKLRDTLLIYETTALNETPAKVFYGECLPLYDDDGTDHADPYCAFVCMGAYPVFELSKESEVFRASGNGGYRELYNALNEGQNCCFLITVNMQVKNVAIEEFPDKGLETFRQEILDERWGFDNLSCLPRGRFQFRVRFMAVTPPTRCWSGFVMPYFKNKYRCKMHS
jgi:hypothetical protein